MILRIDTREQAPLDFSQHEYVDTTKRCTLTVGDYACTFTDGYEPPLVFERKSIPDLFSTLTKGHERFKRELARADMAQVRLELVIEGTLSKVLKGTKHSRIAGITIIRKLMTMRFKYGLTPVFCKDREEMATYIYESYCAIGRLKGKKAKNVA
jgi:ERCC4-type nuclease